MADPEELIDVPLRDVERRVLENGLIEWGGPARGTDRLAVGMGFADMQDLFDTGSSIVDDLRAGLPLRRFDWTRALLATEIVFIDDVMGDSYLWPDYTGLGDAETFHLLRSIQRKLSGVILRRDEWREASE